MFVFFSCLTLLSHLNAGLFEIETFDEVVANNGANCTKLDESQCEMAGQCFLSDGICTADPCYQSVLLSACTGSTCSQVDNTSFCVSQNRLGEFSGQAKCKLEWGEYETVEKGLCKLIAGCGPVIPIPFQGDTYYVCGPGPGPRDPCIGLDEEACGYVGDCMWNEGACITDSCFERTYTSIDFCNNATCTKKTPAFALNPDQSYCKTTGSSLHHWCNVISASGITASTVLSVKKATIPNAATTCAATVTINNFDGETLLVANDVADGDKTFTAVYPDAAASLNPFAGAIFTAAFSVVMMMMMMG